LEVQLGFAATVLATGTGVFWYVLDAVYTVGVPSLSGLLGLMAGCALLQLLAFDLTLFLFHRALWLASVLVGRQDARNEQDAAYTRELEALYDVGSVTFYRSLSSFGTGATLWLAATGAYFAMSRTGLASLTGGVVVAGAGALWLDGVVGPRWSTWRTQVRPWLGNHLGMVEPFFGTQHNRGTLASVGRAFTLLVLTLSNLIFVVHPSLETETPVVRRADDTYVLVRFRLGGLSTTPSRVDLTLTSKTIPAELLERSRHWAHDSMLLALPASELSLGSHTITVEQLNLEDSGVNMGFSHVASDDFVVLE
jgi:hypothetical protein